MERGDRGDWRVAGFELVAVDDDDDGGLAVAVVAAAAPAPDIWNSVSISVDLGL